MPTDGFGLQIIQGRVFLVAPPYLLRFLCANYIAEGFASFWQFLRAEAVFPK